MKKVILLASLLLAACGPSKEEIEAQLKQEELARNADFGIKDVYLSSTYRIVEIDGCQYIILRGEMMLHKANCKNHSQDSRIE